MSQNYLIVFLCMKASLQLFIFKGVRSSLLFLFRYHLWHDFNQKLILSSEKAIPWVPAFFWAGNFVHGLLP